MIAIIDLDVGNIAAVANVLKRIGVQAIITSVPSIVAEADRVIIPGNGSFDTCMRNLRATGLIPVLEQRILAEGVPLLGICVGAQMLGMSSEEGNEPGLGWLNMTVHRFPAIPEFPVPHLGWCSVVRAQDKHQLVAEIDGNARFYFCHSYFMCPSDPSEVLLKAFYGREFTAAVTYRNLVGVQFHPEKSHSFGKQFLQEFAGWSGA